MPEFPVRLPIRRPIASPKKRASRATRPGCSSFGVRIKRCRITASSNCPRFFIRAIYSFYNSRVLHARLLGQRQVTGGKWRGCLRNWSDGHWELMCQTRGRLQAGDVIGLDPGPLTLTLTEKRPGGTRLARLLVANSAPELLQRHGHVPLPPYIRKGLCGAGRYVALSDRVCVRAGVRWQRRRPVYTLPSESLRDSRSAASTPPS